MDSGPLYPRTLGRYELLERIAVGGMAEIYRARLVVAGGIAKTVVVKRILPQYSHDEEFIAMFRDEAALSVGMSQTNVVQVFDFGTVGDEWFLAMEWVHGQDLRRLIRRLELANASSALPVGLAIFVAAEAARGLAYAHTRTDDAGRPLSIVHRDVTPTNILLSYEGEVKIADFGIARAASRGSRTRSGVVKGKAGYLAPEQVRDEPLDARVDLFALGAVLWEMLAGRPLIVGATEAGQLGKLLMETPFPAPSEVRPEIPQELDRVVMRAIARKPDDRYPNARALQEALEALQPSQPAGATDLRTLLRTLFAEELAAESRSGADSVVTRPQPDVSLPLAPTVFVGPRPRGPRRALVAALGLAGLAGVGAWALPRSTPGPIATATVAPVETASAAATATTPGIAGTATLVLAPTGTPRRPVTPAVARSPVAVAGVGILSLDSEPSGDIHVDGKFTGRQTPAWNLEVPAGSRRVRIVNARLRLETEFTVEVRAGQTVRRNETLRKR